MRFTPPSTLRDRRLLTLPGGILAGLVWTLGCSSAAGSAQTQGSDGQGLSITGPTATHLGQTVQFATVPAGQSVVWQVNGTTGGSAATGVISASGLYTAPAAPPSPDPVAIEAVTTSVPAVTATRNLAVWNPKPAITSAIASPTAVTGQYTLDLNGSGLISGSTLTLSTGSAGAITLVSPNELTATLTLPVGSTGVTITVHNPAPGASASSASSLTIYLASYAAASRLLDQATFGATAADIQHVQTVGLSAYLDEQFALPPTLLAPIAAPFPTECAMNLRQCLWSEWWQAALNNPDQLRQRVAFALSEIFVVSTDDFDSRAIPFYQNTLLTDSFTNYRTLMYDVTRTPAMGLYLDMLNNAAPAAGQHADENYARELMQLFTIGINPLDITGTPNTAQLNYTELEVQAFARAYTGWTYSISPAGTSPAVYPNPHINYSNFMAPVEAYHDTTQKTVLVETSGCNSNLPAFHSATQDLNDALDNIFCQSSVAPFVSRQLIQHLVTGAPSPAYVQRVATKFNNDGSGAKGNMQAVLKAILLDPEARGGDTAPTPAVGHLREPILYLAGVLRALGYQNTLPDGFSGNLSNYTGSLLQSPYSSPNVFNFFHPDYTIPALFLPSGTPPLNAPEFQLENTGTVVARNSVADYLAGNAITNFTADLSVTSPLGVLAQTGTDSTALVNGLSQTFLHGQMPASMATSLVAYLDPKVMTDPAQRVRLGVYLVISSSQYKILQ